ncbi:hypothetical protein [Natronorubrum sp. FCH18a]|uniref:hypothetical protein n=1 Tax=Natronorubrum sp. FCH18a TaxID=3447018 RepID=UPI003F5196B7
MNDFLETFAGTVRHLNCNTSGCPGKPLGTLEDRYLCTRCFKRRARLMNPLQLETAIAAESNPFNQQKLEDALVEVREWNEA